MPRLTIKPSLYKFMYLFGRIRIKKIKPNPRPMTEDEWNKAMGQLKELNINL